MTVRKLPFPIYLLLGHFLMVMLCLRTAYAACNVAFEWTQNPESYVQGYKIHYGTIRGGPYDHVFDAGKPQPVNGKITATVVGVPNGTWYFVATAYDSEYESEYSQEVSFVCQGDSGDDTSPGDVTNVTYNRTGERVTFNWINPPDSDYAGVRIVYTTDGSAPALNADGSIRTGDLFADANAPLSTATATLLNNLPYKFAFFAYDTSGNYSHTVFITIPVVTVNYSPNPINDPYIDVTLHVNIQPDCLDTLTYKWNFDDGSDLKTVTTSSITHRFRTSRTFEVVLTLTNDNGCTIIKTIPIEVRNTAPSPPRLH